jgi:RNA polymerase sigma-32 factor
VAELARRQVPSREAVLAQEQVGQNRLSALKDALSVLNPRERRIFEARRLAEDPITLEDLSGEFGISRERVRQSEVCVLETMQEAVKHTMVSRALPQSQVGVP